MTRLIILIFISVGLCNCTSHDATLTEYVQQSTGPAEVTSQHATKTASGTLHTIELKSLTWRDGEVTPAQWRHTVRIFVPEQITSTTAFLLIGNGQLADSSPSKPRPFLEQLATDNHCMTIEVSMVPNQALVFGDETKLRLEDDLVAYSWKHFLETGDRTWLAQYPMVKSVKIIMDHIQAHTSALGAAKIDSFVVSGESKRGWTAWLIAAVDKRVSGVVPMVIDLLNINKSMAHHKRVYQGWSPALKDYQQHGITDLLGTNRFDPIAHQLDPLQYKDRLDMPKYIVNAANDQFFLPDSSQFYFDALPAQKYLRYIPNTGHRIDPASYYKSVSTFVGAVINRMPLPQITWGEDMGRLAVTTDTRPTTVKLWVAVNPVARDFRLGDAFARYKPTTLRPSARGKYLATVRAPKEGWTAYFVELTYNIKGRKFLLSTPVFVKGGDQPDNIPRRKISI